MVFWSKSVVKGVNRLGEDTTRARRGREGGVGEVRVVALTRVNLGHTEHVKESVKLREGAGPQTAERLPTAG